MTEEFENDIDYFIRRINSGSDIIFEWKGVAYHIDCSTNKKGYATNRRIGVFDLEQRASIMDTYCLYDLDINDMLDNHYIDGERLRDIIMQAKCLDLY